MKLDKLLRLIDLPGAMGVIEVAWRDGFREGQKLTGAKYPKLYEDNFVFEYIKHLKKDSE